MSDNGIERQSSAMVALVLYHGSQMYLRCICPDRLLLELHALHLCQLFKEEGTGVFALATALPNHMSLPQSILRNQTNILRQSSVLYLGVPGVAIGMA